MPDVDQITNGVNGTSLDDHEEEEEIDYSDIEQK